ncbi:arrestin homolog [Oratosquilla oratoria]|uniref:arrestin homolog n=1 Tax=Oratosquilla oratoria TaxID=337810 RepID=UPI003F76AE55
MANTIKVFHKTAPNGRVSCYLSRRDFVETRDQIEPVDGVVVVSNDYLKGRSIFAQVRVTYQFGQEEDEILGNYYHKEVDLVRKKVYPSSESCKPTEIQDRLIARLGSNAYPFTVSLPANSPESVTLEPGGKDKLIGVTYDLRLYAANNEEEEAHKRNTVNFNVRKIRIVNMKTKNHHSQVNVYKTFLMPPGHLDIEVSLNKDIYYHGQQIDGAFFINNKSKKIVKYAKCEVVQHLECTMNNYFFSQTVANLDTHEGFPVVPGTDNQKSFRLVALASTLNNRLGIALDGRYRDEDVNLPSSTLTSPEQDLNDTMGVLVSYSVRVTFNCGSIGGNVSVEVPFRLVHSPCPEEKKMLKRTQSVESYSEDGIVFEDFTRLRRGQSISDGTSYA